MDRLGGLIHRMPWTGAFFLADALAIVAVPPLNGFSSEWLIVQNLLRGVEFADVEVRGAFAVAGALVALTAGLAVTAFVRAFGMSFLGLPRTSQAHDAREVRWAMRVGMGLLTAICLILAVIPTYIVNALGPVVTELHAPGGNQALAPPFFAPQSLPRALWPIFTTLAHRSGKAGFLAQDSY